MSHITTITDICISDVSALEQAVSDLNEKGISCELAEKEEMRAYSNSEVDLVLRLKGSDYDVGFSYNEINKAYDIQFDEWENHIFKVLGIQENGVKYPVAKLTALYSKHAILNRARMLGHTISGFVENDNKIEISLNVGE